MFRKIYNIDYFIIDVNNNILFIKIQSHLYKN